MWSGAPRPTMEESFLSPDYQITAAIDQWWILRLTALDCVEALASAGAATPVTAPMLRLIR